MQGEMGVLLRRDIEFDHQATPARSGSFERAGTEKTGPQEKAQKPVGRKKVAR